MNGADNFKSEELATEIVVKGTYKLENAKKSGSNAVYNYAEKTAYWPIKLLRRMKWQQLRLSI